MQVCYMWFFALGVFALLLLFYSCFYSASV